MKDGFLKVAAGVPEVRVADCVYNKQGILNLIKQAEQQGVKLLVLPELCLTGATCGDLFFQPTLIKGAEQALSQLLEETERMDTAFIVGLPVAWKGCLYDCAALCQHGEILGMIPKTKLSAAESRQFSTALPMDDLCTFCGQPVRFGNQLLFDCAPMDAMVLAVTFDEAFWSPEADNTQLGANVVCCLSADPELVTRAAFRREMVTSQTARTVSACIFASAGEGESTSDLVFAGHCMVAENGTLLAEQRFETGLLVTELDVQALGQERRRLGGFQERIMTSGLVLWEETETVLTRPVATMPFVPADKQARDAACEEIFHLAALGLKRRLEHTHAKTAVIGLSGGLDSTLALLVIMKAFDLLGRDHRDILAVTMPCFGTTQRTKSNAQVLAERIGCTFRTVPIADSVRSHFKDIGQSMDCHDVTFENGQARERTQVLMDLANMYGGMVVGTGDLSELALGWATYNGDHMSMYGVNGSIPKTLVRHLVAYVAEQTDDIALCTVLKDILDTPVSPELLPAKDGEIAQKTEDLVGPYELHDFFLYYIVRWGFPPTKVFRLAQYALGETYDRETILKWLKTFYLRFFQQQFKRNCLPDGPKIGSVNLSPRGSWQMPSDALWTLWQQELEQL